MSDSSIPPQTPTPSTGPLPSGASRVAAPSAVASQVASNPVSSTAPAAPPSASSVATPTPAASPATPSAFDLLDPVFLRRLERLQILTRKVFRGRMKGERRSRKKGQSVEFADYRDYVRGDDTRFLDWNIYARLERLFLKLFLEEEDLAFYLVVDVSQSMNFGRPMTKFDYARRVAAALGSIALANQDKVGVAAFSRGLDDVQRPIRGKGQLPKLLSFLRGLQPAPATSLTQSCREFVARHKQSGIVVIVSDFLDDFGYEEALKQFFHRPYDVYAIHLLSEQELHPEETGHLEFIDSETGERQEVTVSDGLLAQYRRTLEAFCGGLRDWCNARGITYIPTSTAIPIDTLLLNYLRRRGLLG